MSEELLKRIESELRNGPGTEAGNEGYRRVQFDGPEASDVLHQWLDRNQVLKETTREDALGYWGDEEEFEELFQESGLADEKYYRLLQPIAEARNGSPEFLHLMVAEVAPDAVIVLGPKTRRRHQMETEDLEPMVDPAPWTEEVSDAVSRIEGAVPFGKWEWQTSFARERGDALFVADTSFPAALFRYLIASRHLSFNRFTPDGLFEGIELLDELFGQELEDSHVFVLGSWSDYQIVLVGRDGDGRWVGVETAATWT